MPSIIAAGKTWAYDLFTAANPRAIIIAIHGAAADSVQMATMTKLHLQGAAAVVAYVNGQPTVPSWLWWLLGKGQTWNVADQPRDLQFFAALVDRLKSGEWADLPVYVVGHSAGATMAYRVACSIAAVTQLVATAAGLNPMNAAKAPEDLWHLHGDADTIVPFATYQPSIQAGIDLLASMGARTKLTLLPGVGHDVWGARPLLPTDILARWALL